MENGINFYTALITACLTLIGGLILFIFERLIEKIIIDPIQKQKETIENIAILLIRNAHLYSNPQDISELPTDNPFLKKRINAVYETKQLRALLEVRSNNIPRYNWWVRIRYVVPKENIKLACGNLTGLSNGYYRGGEGAHNGDLADKIRDLLNIPKD